MGEAQPLGRVVELDVDAQVVAVHLELVAGYQPAGLVDVQSQVGDLAVDVEPPVPVVLGGGVERDVRGGGLIGVGAAGHGLLRWRWPR
jgi:hypothetical protein